MLDWIYFLCIGSTINIKKIITLFERYEAIGIGGFVLYNITVNN